MTKKERLDLFWLGVKYLVVAVAIAVVVRGFLLIPVPVVGNSMENSLHQGDMVVMERMTKIKRFDVVVFRLSSGTTYIKRVIGMPGDTLRYEDDQLYINDKPVAEPFLKELLAEDHSENDFTNDFSLTELTGEQKLGKNSYFVLGDNRRTSKDSRSFGAIQGENIIGKARFVYYPLKHWHLI
ncbi:signal peptidase I [Enterococcus asini]|uniref:signal peptidase I n=1 Tax=Enterococcus asini TaxID=57732 RepID=UPI0013874E7F|nr:signal peptidase I [Enterococcus asini]MDT2743508.1 signal peptidase I [Enterococcus asini]